MIHFDLASPHFYVIGAGGTGGFFIQNLVRLMAGRDNPVKIDIYDGDRVEAKNLKRQNFTVDDLDHFKAESLVDRLSKSVFDAPVLTAHNEFLTDDRLVEEIALLPDGETPIIVDATDNAATRLLIDKTVKDLTGIDTIVLSSGNHDQGGQVVVWANFDPALKTITGSKPAHLSSMTALFPETGEIKDERDQNPGLVSVCAEESESKPQAMMANVLNADVLSALAVSLADNHSVDCNVYKINLASLSVQGILQIS